MLLGVPSGSVWAGADIGCNAEGVKVLEAVCERVEEGTKAEEERSCGEVGRDVFCTVVENAWQVSESRGIEHRTVTIAMESLLDLFVDGVYWASAALSPADLEDYAVGVLFSAGAIDTVDEVASVIVTLDKGGTEARVDVTTKHGLRDQDIAGQRHATGEGGIVRRRGIPSSVHSWAHRDVAGDLLTKDRRGTRGPDWEPIESEAVWRMTRSLLARQGMHKATGATHAAVFANRQGIPVLMREDVGRHNAVEKLIGSMLKANVDPSDGFVYLSSRCALELVAKCARLGASIVATVSAPTSAVLEYGEREGIALLAFARDGRFTIYTHPELVHLPSNFGIGIERTLGHREMDYFSSSPWL